MKIRPQPSTSNKQQGPRKANTIHTNLITLFIGFGKHMSVTYIAYIIHSIIFFVTIFFPIVVSLLVQNSRIFFKKFSGLTHDKPSYLYVHNLNLILRLACA